MDRLDAKAIKTYKEIILILDQCIDGAIIVCEGGDNKELVNDITNAVYGLLNVPVHKIKVMKMS